MQIFPIKKLYLPALSIVAVGFILLVLISISTYRNLDRQKTMALSFLQRQGEGLILSLEASARTGMKTLMWQEVSLGSLLQETAKSRDIAYVCIIDEHGTFAHHSDPLKAGAIVEWKILEEYLLLTIMQIFPIKKLYLPALSIVGDYPLVLISISTYRNLDRQKTIALSFLHRQGEGLILSLEASARTGMKTLMWQEVSLGSLLQETAKSRDIAYVYIIDEHGTIVHHSDPLKAGAIVDWKPHITEEDQIDTRIKTLPDSTQIYELAKFFSPMYEPTMMHHRNSQMGLDSGHLANSHSHRGDTIILGMKMTAYEQARHADIQHAFIMAAIILILGSGAFFFIFVIQNYYLVDKTLKQTKDYTREVVANMANGLISIDSEGKIVSFNLLALELLGIEESEAQGMDLRTLIDFEISGIQSTLTECVPVLDYEIYHPA